MQLRGRRDLLTDEAIEGLNIRSLRGYCGAAPGETAPMNSMGTADNPIAAVLVFKDPSDWYRDAQLALDIVLSGT